MLALATGLVPCGNACLFEECQLGEARCDGSVACVCHLKYSDSSAPTAWDSIDCAPLGKVCAHCSSGGGQRAFCAASHDVDPKCGEETSSYCEENEVVGCLRCGYTWGREACGERFCVQAKPSDALCARSTTRDPRCPGADVQIGGYCDGPERFVHCRYGYATFAEVCKLGCKTSPVVDGYAHCRASWEDT